MPPIQTCFLALQITENIKKLSKMVSKGIPKIHQQSIKIHPRTFQGPSQCICDPLGGKMVPKWCPRTSKWKQNGHPRTLKVHENQRAPTSKYVTKRYTFWPVLHWFRSWKFFNSCKSMQIADYMTAGCQRGRRQGRSLKIYSIRYDAYLNVHFRCPGNMCV